MAVENAGPCVATRDNVAGTRFHKLYAPQREQPNSSQGAPIAVTVRDTTSANAALNQRRLKVDYDNSRARAAAFGAYLATGHSRQNQHEALCGQQLIAVQDLEAPGTKHEL